MIVPRVSVLVAALCLVMAMAAHAQTGDDAEIIEEDYRVTSVEDRQRSVSNLLSRADELSKSGQAIEAARTLNRVGRFQIRMALMPDAVTTFEKALKLLDQYPDVKTRIDSLNGLASSYDNLSRCDLAKPKAREASDLSQRHNYVAGHADALLTLSDCQNQRDHSLALKTAHQSLELWRSINRKRGMAEAYKAIGHYHLAQSNLIESNRSMEASLALYRELNDRNRQAAVLLYLAMIEHRKGAWQSALAYYSQVQSMIDEKAEPYKMGQIAANLGEAFLESGLPDVALAKFREALEHFRRSENKRAILGSHASIGRAHYFLGDYQQALDNLRIALSEAQIAKDTTLTALCDDFLGRTYTSLNDYDAALNHFKSALEGYTMAKNPMEAARTQALIGQVYQQQGSLAMAGRKYRTALKTFRDLADHVNESATLYAIGNLNLQQDNLSSAEDYLKRSIDATEHIRRSSTSNDLTVAFSAAVYDRYQSYVECLMRQEKAYPGRGFAERAFETSELARARSLAELLRATETNLAPGVDLKLMEKEKSLRQTLKVKENYRVALLAGDYEREELHSLERELARLDQEHKQVSASIQSQYPAYKQMTSPGAWSLKDIQEKVIVDDQTVLLEYSLGKGKSYVWAVTRDRLTSYELPAEAVIVEKVQKLYKLLAEDPNVNKKDEVSRAAQELSELVLSPLGAELDKSRILLAADSALNYIPFQLLPKSSDDPSLLVANYEIVNTPSASILGELRQEVVLRQPGKLLALFGDPAYEVNYATKVVGSDQLAALHSLENQRGRQGRRDIEFTGDSLEISKIKPLFWAKREIANLREVAAGRETFVATDFDATREKLLNTDLTSYAILHFATHGYLNAKYPEHSGLVLSTVTREGHAQNGFVSLKDIYQLRVPVDLVVLSACQTGLGKDVRGEGLIGLTRGFMYAGASNVVASLWEVDDEATAELMKRFYANMLQEGMTPAAALRAAQNSIRQQPQWSAPYYWAAFTLQGDHRQSIKPFPQPAFAPYSTVLLIASLGALLGIALWFYFRRRAQRMSLAK